MPGFYDISVPVFVRYLENLDAILQKMDDFIRAHEMSESELLNMSLREDMHPLKWQLKIAIGFSARALNPVLEHPIILEEVSIDTIDGIRSLLVRTIEKLGSISSDDLANAERMLVKEEAGQGTFERNALEFLTQYALPNFFFHLCMAYSILRLAGCPVGKGDFDGFHQYEPGFRLVDQVRK